MTAWKRNERQLAAYLGGKRVPITGRQRGDVPDIAHEHLAIEAKLRERLPQWILDGLEQALAASAPDQLPCLVLRQKYQRVADSLVVLRLRDFADIAPTSPAWRDWAGGRHE